MASRLRAAVQKVPQPADILCGRVSECRGHMGDVQTRGAPIKANFMWVELMTSFYDLSLAIASVFLLAALMWSVSLRRRVKEQTVQIREQVAREVELQNRYKELFENANDLVFSMDTEGYFTTLNRAGENIFGISRKQASTTRLRDLLLPEFAGAFDTWTEELKKNVSPARCDVEAFGRDRQAVALEINVMRV